MIKPAKHLRRDSREFSTNHGWNKHREYTMAKKKAATTDIDIPTKAHTAIAEGLHKRWPIAISCS